MTNDGFEASENSEPDPSLEAAVRRIFDDLSREEFGETADMFAVTRDDELLDWLGTADLDAEPAPTPAQDPADAELIEMLLAWRRSITTDAPELVPPRPPEGADAPTRRRAGRLRRIPVVSVALAVLMVCVGLGVAVQDAMPDDPLWGVSKALNSERAASIETTQTRRYLDVAHTELLLGHQAAAAAALAAAQREIAQMRPDNDKRELQARHRELTNQLNRTTPAPGQASGSAARTPPARQRKDSAMSIRADEQRPRPSRSPLPQAAAPAGTPSTTTEPSISDEPATGTPDSSAAASDTQRPSRSAPELSEWAAVGVGSPVDPSRYSESPPSDPAREDGNTAAAASSGSAQSSLPSGAPSSGSAGRAEDTHSDSRHERHATSSPPSSTTHAQPTEQPAQPQSPSPANRDSSASPTPTHPAQPAPQPQPSPTSSPAVESATTAPPKDKTATDTSANRVNDHNTAAAVTADSSTQPSSTTSRSSKDQPSSPGSTAQPTNQNHAPPPVGTSATTARNRRDGQEQPQ